VLLFFFFLFFFSIVLGFELRASCLVRQVFYIIAVRKPFFSCRLCMNLVFCTEAGRKVHFPGLVTQDFNKVISQIGIYWMNWETFSIKWSSVTSFSQNFIWLCRAFPLTKETNKTWEISVCLGIMRLSNFPIIN
jgi:hypothetical protein